MRFGDDCAHCGLLSDSAWFGKGGADRSEPGPARIDMGEKLQWCEMTFFNCGFISKCAGHDGYGVPAGALRRGLTSVDWAHKVAARFRKAEIADAKEG